MTHGTDKWMAEILDWFEAHPEREYYLGQMPVTSLMFAGMAGWVVGSATGGCPQGPGAGSFQIEPGQKSVLCVIRRPDPISGRPLPGLFVCDRAPPLPREAENGRAAEAFAAGIWAMAQMTAAVGLPLAAMAGGLR